MKSRRHWRKRARFALGMAFTTAIALTGSAQSAATAPRADEAALGRHDEKLLAEAVQRGQRTVTLLVMTRRGAAARGADQLSRAGARVGFRADEIGYVRVEAPVDQVRKLAALPDVRAVDVAETVQLDDPRPGGQTAPTPQPPPDATTPRVNAYLPTGDTGAAQFAQAHPAWDGRGVRIAVVDSGVDLGHPSLNTTSTGERKIVDWVTYTDGEFVNGANVDNDPTWVHMTGSLPADHRPPAGAGAVSFGVFDERVPRMGGAVGNDVNRDGNPAGSVGTFGVTWDRATDTVWVDTNQNKDFTDDKAMTNYKVRNDVGHFGTDNPATPIAESMPFAVRTDPAHQSVNIGLTLHPHGSHVAGIAAGNRLFGGAMSGAAPGAKLISVRACVADGCTTHGLFEGMIYAARDANADVVNLSVGGLIALNDGNSAQALLYNSLVDTYDVQLFLSGGNGGPGVNSAGDPSVAAKVISSGNYISRASWQRNYGSDSAAEDNLYPSSARGPREDGGFKPNVIAPGSAISTTPTWAAGQPVPGTYQLPPGYSMFNGTSMASPQTAGAAALLLSAARANGVGHSAAQLRRAITFSTRSIPGYQAHEQGAGLIQVDRAWELLRANVTVTDIRSAVPVRTAQSDLLPTANIGVGIHDREGVRVGDSYTREYTFTRDSGPESPITYQVSWQGNDGTFRSPTTITLRKGHAVKLQVEVNPRTAGVHSAILELDSPMTTGTEYQTMNTVVAAEELNASNGFTVRHSGSVSRNRTVSHFVRVAAGTPVLKVDLQAGAGQIRFLRYTPWGTSADSNNLSSCFTPPAPGGSCANGSPTSRTIDNPTPGVWEVVVESRFTSDAASTPYTVTTSALGVPITPNPDTIPSARIGEPVNRQYTLNNTLAGFTGQATSTALGSAHLATPTITEQARQEFQVMVTPGTTQLRARIGGVSDLGADLDLYVFDCSSGTCVQRGSQADRDSEETVTITTDLKPGTWMVRVVAFTVPSGSTTFNYLDVFSAPSFGSLNVSDTSALRQPGTQWTVPGVLTANAAPARGRVLHSSVEARTDTGLLLGSADVIVQNVS
ncbi:S8 family serine peptidase [Allokutzneria sp. A3M-2-11 16]|uniref:S8 family serine peptidase n=1 Tax=Allokutzneria sp. A3M-2-11 16 TaxID=2962043 RepID=UPI0020B70E67|nr:S8 family serine peptidase [Allokutzneria sp. A3M-2-11 16]MCP3802022.1 S8 family serine peptidase [Allokutzneria sp. A3M-2-11 16]